MASSRLTYAHLFEMTSRNAWCDLLLYSMEPFETVVPFTVREQSVSVRGPELFFGSPTHLASSSAYRASIRSLASFTFGRKVALSWGVISPRAISASGNALIEPMVVRSRMRGVTA